MTTRDVATIAFRLLAVWMTVSALSALVELLFTWRAVWAQAAAMWSNVSNPPTPGQYFFMSTTAFLASGIVGMVMWRLSPLLARLACPRDGGFAVAMTRYDVYAAASFLVGLYLIAISAPGLAFAFYASTRPGFPAYPEARPKVPLLLVQCVLGISLVRGQWLVRWAMNESASHETEES